ncbi:acyltransferase family protein [Amycolatopsis aidingensis]|uniref:acyltransferase family protein n=1 Tax=Amycolatopsis aidingensis TaxID=2842453 RepID=UPI001C0E483E|nr:acyltransferase family protein [Amycolatopsis aidingensis]
MSLLRADPPVPTQAPPDTSSARRYRPELQGLRALAAVLVVVYHVWFDRISGGVDVFFLISGFLITGQLVRASERGRIEFRPMWGRMIKRLFPAALTVLAAIIVAGWLLLPQGRWLQTISEVFASALYLENWRLVADSVDYFAQHNTASVVQHFWSLSIQGQFYLVWPLLVALVALVARLAGRGLRGSMALTLLVLFAASLAYSVVLTGIDQPMAYFHSLTRVWEFALGGLLALGIQLVTVPRAVRLLLGWAGVAGLVSCGLLLQVGSVFPGYAALWPTMAALLVIVAGATASPFGADRLLSSRPLEYLGNLSYALYLWHWPVLLFYLVLRDRAEAGIAGGALVIAVSVALSVLTYHLIEKPARESRFSPALRWGAYRFGVLALLPVLVLAGAWQVTAEQRAAVTITADDPDHPGALARTEGFMYTGAAEPELVPSFVTLHDDFAEIAPELCTMAGPRKEVVLCSTDTEGPPARRIVVAGDSHPQQFLGALLPIAQRRNWQVISMLRGGCPFSTESDIVPGDQPCMDWNTDVIDLIAEIRPDVVFTTATREVRMGLTEYTPRGYVEQWRKVEELGIPVVAARDNPRYDFEPSACVEKHGRDAERCARPRAELLSPEPPYARMASLPANVRFLDFSDYFCTEELCPPVIGNVLVYMDNNHISATYMTTMAPIVEEKLTSVLDW